MDCPICFNSSGYNIFLPTNYGNQKCDTCNGRGTISKRLYTKLTKQYGNLLSNNKGNKT